MVSGTRAQVPGSISRVSPLHPSCATMPSFVIVGTYPPTQCGIATFTAALANGLGDAGVPRVGVVRLGAGDALSWDPRVVAEIYPGLSRSRLDAARAVNAHDVMLLQHEFGIFGGEDGDEVLDILDDVVIPVVVTLHTVPLHPSAGQRRVLEELMGRVDAVVTMTRIARSRLLANYSVNPDKVVTIPHGATVPGPVEGSVGHANGHTGSAGNGHRSTAGGNGHRPTRLLTWGLLGPGKGIEWMIEALARVADLRGNVHYTVAGQTHPKVRATRGEDYRDMLRRRASALGISDMVDFDDSYRRLPELLDLVGTSTCVVLPYDSEDQITSGVLVDAISAGKPVIATGFPHAVELLCSGVGILVPHRDPVGLADAIRAITMNPDLVSSMARATRPVAAEHRWSAVAARYAALSSQFVPRQTATG